MATVKTSRGEGGKVHINVTLTPEQMLNELTASEVIHHYRFTLYQLLDLIGKEKCKQYFNLKEEDGN
jgi:hypothetical protein